MAEVFDEGGWFEQMVSSEPEMAEMMEEGASMADMQGSFASFMRHRSTLTLTLTRIITLTLTLTCMRHSMGGGDGSVLMPDGSSVAAPRMAMPSLHALIEGATNPNPTP